MEVSETCETLERMSRILKNDCSKCESKFKLGGIERCSAEKNRDSARPYFSACGSVVAGCTSFRKKKK